MKKILLFFLFVISIFSYADTKEKSAEEIMDKLREKIAKREQEKIRQQEEVERQKQAEQERIEKESEKLMNEKRRELISEPLIDKFGRAKNKDEATKKALEIGKTRISFVKVKEEIKGEQENTLSSKYDSAYEKFEENSKKMQKILDDREELQKKLRQLDELEKKIQD